jgi:hypothetical protein
MGFEIGAGITIGGGIIIELPSTPSTVTYIETENLEPLLTESGDNLITES